MTQLTIATDDAARINAILHVLNICAASSIHGPTPACCCMEPKTAVLDRLA